MFAVLLHYPFEPRESRRNPSTFDFRVIDEIKSWVADLEMVTIPLMQAFKLARYGLHNVLEFYASYSREYEHNFVAAFIDHEPFLNSLSNAHGIGYKVREQLKEIERHDESGIIGDGLLALGFLAASVTFVISVLVPLHKPLSPILRKAAFWEPIYFYLVALVIIGYLISKPIAFCMVAIFVIIMKTVIKP